MRAWLRRIEQTVLSFLRDERRDVPEPPPEPRYPPGFTYTNDGCFVVWTCQTCGYAFTFTQAYDPANVLHALRVHRVRCEVRPAVSVVSAAGAGRAG